MILRSYALFPTATAASSFAATQPCCPSPTPPIAAPPGYPNEANEFPFDGEQNEESAASAFGWTERTNFDFTWIK